MCARPRVWPLIALRALGAYACCSALTGCGGGATTDGDVSPTVVITPSTAPSASPPGRRGRVTDAAWSDVEGWLAKREVCWAVPFGNARAFITRCDGTEHRTTLPRADSLKKAVDAADPEHDTIGYTTHYEAYREIPWPAAAALFPTGTVYEVEVNQNKLMRRVANSEDVEATVSSSHSC